MTRAQFMRSSWLLGALLLPAAAQADIPPIAPPPPVPAPVAPSEPAPPPPPLVPNAEPPALAEKPKPTEIPSPLVAWGDIQKSMATPEMRKPGALETKVKDYLQAWESTGREPASEDLHALGLLLNVAKRTAEATARFRASAECEALEAPHRAQSAVHYANQVLQAAREGRIAGADLAQAVTRVEGWSTLPAQGGRGPVLLSLGSLHVAAGSLDKALEAFAMAAETAPSLSLSAGTQAVHALMEGTDDLSKVAPARAKASALLTRLTAAQSRGIETARANLASEADATNKPRLEQGLRVAEAGLERLKKTTLPLDMLGEQAAAWTLVKAYGKGQSLADYRGKVVVLDFWATWCPWCIKSFPALRDLLKDYAGQDLAVVGVTASAGSVYDQRYDLDDDLKAKSTGQPKPLLSRPKPPGGVRLGTEPAKPPEDEAVAKAAYDAALATFRTKEMEVLATFVANHQMTWDVVQIDEAEPAPKYALSGWPHCVVIDRQGRVRHFKSGALLRDKPEAVAAFRKVLDRLLAEPK